MKFHFKINVLLMINLSKSRDLTTTTTLKDVLTFVYEIEIDVFANPSLSEKRSFVFLSDLFSLQKLIFGPSNDYSFKSTLELVK